MKTKLLLMLPMAMMMMACVSEQQPRPRVPEYEDITDANSVTMIPYEPQGDHEIVTVAFNGVPMNLLWDTGCSVTTIPYTEFARMIREDKISGYDYNDTKYAQIADGSIVENYEFNIATVTFNTVDGKPYVLHDVAIMVSPNPNSSLLLGKNVIDRLGEYHRNEKETCFVFKK